MSASSFVSGLASGAKRGPFSGCSWMEDFVKEPPAHTLAYEADGGDADGATVYARVSALYRRMTQGSSFPIVTSTWTDVPSIGNIHGGDASRCLFLGGVVSPDPQYSITFAPPDSAPTSAVWLRCDTNLVGGPTTWLGAGQPFSLRLENADASVVVELTTASVTQNYSSGTACNGHILGSHSSYVIAATITGGALVAQAPFDIIAPQFGAFGEPGLSGPDAGQWRIFASIASGLLHVEWWNQIYCFQHQTYELSGSVDPSNGFTRASVTVTAPLRLSSDDPDYAAMILESFERYCGPRADDPFHLL